MDTIGYNKALFILAQHGLAAETLTEVKDGILVEGTDFETVFGIKLQYSKKAILDWLGY